MTLRHIERTAGKLAHNGQPLWVAQCKKHIGQLHV